MTPRKWEKKLPMLWRGAERSNPLEGDRRPTPPARLVGASRRLRPLQRSTAYAPNQVQLAWFGGCTGIQARRQSPDQVLPARECEDRAQAVAAGKSFTFGVRSVLVAAAAERAPAPRDPQRRRGDPPYPLLFDPQTAGGFRAAVSAARAEACVAALEVGVYPHAAVAAELWAEVGDGMRG